MIARMGQALGEQGLHSGMPTSGVVRAPPGGRGPWRGRGFLRGLGCRLLQAAAVPGDHLVDRFGQVVHEVPAVRDLDRVRSAPGGAVGVGTAPVTADDLYTRVAA